MPLLLPLAILSSSALAAWPEDVDLGGMTEQGGITVVDPAVVAEDYERLIRELGMSVGTQYLPAPWTLGTHGFEIALEGGTMLTSTQGDEEDPAPWQRAQAAEDPAAVMFQPGISIRKGLPLSLEVGFSGRWIGMSRQGVMSGFVRAALIEGFKPWPDVVVHMGYSGYIGNDQLKLGVFNVGLGIGTRAPAGSVRGARNASISPYADVSLLVVSAAPVVNADTYIGIGATTWGSRGTTWTVDEEGDVVTGPNAKPFLIPQFNGGFQVNGGHFVIRIVGGYGLKASAWVGGSVGVSY